MDAVKTCPACAESIAVEALKCRWCGETLGGPPPAPTNDEEHLRLLSIFHYVSGGMTAFLACIPLVHVAIGLTLAFSPETFTQGEAKNSPPPAWFGLFFAVVGGFFVLAGWTLAVLKFIAGRCLARRRRRTFCTVVAGICCIFPPLGTILGIFTLVVLHRPSVKALFDRAG